jgi:nitrile hydratase accessory protein
MSPDAATLRATLSVQSIPRNAEGPVFREPWEAEAFALALSLNQRGLFTWTEWAATLGEEIKKAQAAGDPDTGETYYRHWLATLERIVAAKGLADANVLARTRTPGSARAHVPRTARRSRWNQAISGNRPYTDQSAVPGAGEEIHVEWRSKQGGQDH